MCKDLPTSLASTTLFLAEKKKQNRKQCKPQRQERSYGQHTVTDWTAIQKALQEDQTIDMETHAQYFGKFKKTNIIIKRKKTI